MADYYPLIQKAVAGLDKSTGETRRALYDRARTALLAQLRGVEPALSEPEITRERLALEEAIRKVEGEVAFPRTPEAARRMRAESPASGRRVIDRPPDERMPEAEAAWHIAWHQQRCGQERVERRQRRAFLELGGRDCDIERHRVTHHRRGASEVLRRVGQRADLLIDRQRDAVGHVGWSHRRP